MYRWNENYSHLVDKRGNSWYDQLKYTPLGKDAYISFGGTLRHRLNMYDNDNFGLRGVADGHLLLNRALLHADVHLGDYVRTFIELGAHQADGYDLTSGPFDEDDADVTQAFVDLRLDQSTLRLGRQEMGLGSARLLSVRDGPNVRRSFDGIRFDTSIADSHLRLFILSEVEVDEGAFDNDTNDDQTLWGVYNTSDFGFTEVDTYYLGLYRGGATYHQGQANETRHSLGTRIFGSKNNWDWNYEFVYQFGDFGDANINAWTVASITGYSFNDTMWSPRLSLSANIASGDDDENDDDLNTFNPLLPNLAYFEEAAVFSPQNFYNVEPEVTIYPTDKLSISADWNFFWRLEDNDAVYVRGSGALSGTAGASGDFVAHVPSISIDYQINQHIKFDISYSHFFAQEVVENAGGDDVSFFKTELTWKF
jgi:hypothetical protein